MHFIFALSFLQRLRGLLARKPSWLGEDGVLVIAPCNSIHTFGMKYSIDVAFLDRNGKVLLAKQNFEPKKRLFCKNAVCVLERICSPERQCAFPSGQNSLECTCTLVGAQSLPKHTRIPTNEHDSLERTCPFFNEQGSSECTQALTGAQNSPECTKALTGAQEKIIPWFSAGDYCELSISRKST